MQPALHNAGRELHLAVLPVVNSTKVSRGDDDEGGVASEALVAADTVELLA